MSKGLSKLIVQFLSTKSRDLFTVRLGSTLLLAKYGIVGVPATILGWFLRSAIGVLIDDATFLIDIGLDAIREGMKLEEFHEHAKAAYEKATAKIYDEARKAEIRKEYLDIISKIGVVGDGPRT